MGVVASLSSITLPGTNSVARGTRRPSARLWGYFHTHTQVYTMAR